MTQRIFLKNETGAVTVDWVVMTAAVVGLGIATMGVVQTGLGSNGASGTLVAGILKNTRGHVTDFLGIPDAIHGVGERFASFGTNKFAFKTEIPIDLNAEGVIFEVGGAGKGTVFYQHDGKLYLQAGGGVTSESDPNVLAWDLSNYTGTGPAVIEGQLSGDGIKLYINGESVGRIESPGQLMGTGSGGTVGSSTNASDSVQVNLGNFGATDGHPAVGDVKFYLDRTSGDEADP